ncbi:MAG: hypothetical protein K9G40_08180 [Crocinitomicaceae bacterium]|nr:hypothetical protein [Crocinitomicaceae bacterium]
MKLKIAFLVSVFISLNSWSQNELKFNIGLNNCFNYPVSFLTHYDHQFQNLTSIDFSVGIKKFDFGVNYGFGGMTRISKDKPSIFYDYNYHLVGLSFYYRFLEDAHKVEPYVKTYLATQVATNYKNGPLDHNLFTENDSYFADSYYYSTNLVGNLNFGCNIKIVSKISMNLSLGYGIMNIKTKSLSGVFKNNVLHHSVYQIGLIYTLNYLQK